VKHGYAADEQVARPVFIPTKEVLSLARGIRHRDHDPATVEMIFDDTYVDLALQPIRSAVLIAIIRGRLADFRATAYPKLLERAARAGSPAQPEQPAAPPLDDGDPSESTPQQPPPERPRPEFVAVGALPVAFPKAFLADEADVAAYVETLRTTLVGAIRDGKRISL
jgi:hypothetical protein